MKSSILPPLNMSNASARTNGITAPDALWLQSIDNIHTIVD